MPDNKLDHDSTNQSVVVLSAQSIAKAFDEQRPRLRRMVMMRLHNRVRARIDPSDILQEAFLDIARRVDEYLANPTMPVYVWMHFLTEQRLLAEHRRHLGTQMRDARLELPLDVGAPDVTSLLADRLLSQLSTPSSAAQRRERLDQLNASLSQLSEDDQMVLALRNFEELTNEEVAAVLSIKPSAASARYLRALERLRKILARVPDFFS